VSVTDQLFLFVLVDQKTRFLPLKPRIKPMCYIQVKLYYQIIMTT